MVESAVYQLLSGDTQLSSLLSAESIFLLEKPSAENRERYIVHYPLDNIDVTDLALKESQSESAYRVQCYAGSALQARLISARVKEILHAYSGEIDGISIDRILFRSSVLGLEDQAESGQKIYSTVNNFTIYFY